MERRSALHACIVWVLCIIIVLGQDDKDEIDVDRPCEHADAINLPQDNRCVVPIKRTYEWDVAASNCERARGSLYQPPEDRLDSRPTLMACLASMSHVNYGDMWINAFGTWSPHFSWTNGSLVSPVDYCTTIRPTTDDQVPMTRDTLSVDYCVQACNARGAAYTVLYNDTNFPKCFCKHSLDAQLLTSCPRDSVDYQNHAMFYIVHGKRDALITQENSDAFSGTLCVTVDFKERGPMRSSSCFTKRPFICSLGETSKCSDKPCSASECYFTYKDKCMVREFGPYTWFAARSYCQKLGGDLWNMDKLSDLVEMKMTHIEGMFTYWTGATNYRWIFNATSASRATTHGNLRQTACGHMIQENDVTFGVSWQWSDTVCDQKKAYLCQFAKPPSSQSSNEGRAECPWPIVDLASKPTPGPLVTAIPVIVNTSGEDNFPIAAVIAAIIAGIILLVVLALIFAYCSKRRWWSGRVKKAHDELTFIPYIADMSADNGAMSSVSDLGSQTGLVKSGHRAGMSGYGLSTSYGEHSGAFSSKSLDRNHKEVSGRHHSDNHDYHANGNTSLDERGMAATYSTLSNKAIDYMTLQARMDIRDDNEFGSMRSSARNKPEVALVTDNADMNFTVNHAVSRSLSSYEGSLPRSPLERTIEEITLPVSEGGIGLNLPERVAEEARLYSDMTGNYHK